ncbi:MAG: hypothetical protein JRI68_25375 [Deltaproteobacteria bacterium]|nr:hypothetical protein [Deltaproteobacteria bacterium]
MSKSQRCQDALTAARRAEVPEEIVEVIEGWDGDFLELEERADGSYVLTVGAEERPLEGLVGARLGFELDNAGVEFEAELPTALYSRDTEDGKMKRERDLSRAAAVVVVQKAPKRKAASGEGEAG